MKEKSTGAWSMYMCVCTFPFFFTAKILVIAALPLDWSEDLCCSCPIAELGSPHLPTYHFCCLMVPTSFQNLSPLRELPCSNSAYCRAQILPPTSAHSPGLLQVLQSSAAHTSPGIFLFHSLNEHLTFLLISPT